MQLADLLLGIYRPELSSGMPASFHATNLGTLALAMLFVWKHVS